MTQSGDEAFLFEVISKNEDQDAYNQTDEVHEEKLDFMIARRFKKWKGKAWVMLEFQCTPKPNPLTTGAIVIQLNSKPDAEQVAGSSKKKLKQVYEYL